MDSGKAILLEQSLAKVLPVQEAVAERFLWHAVRLEMEPRSLFSGAVLHHQPIVLLNVIAAYARTAAGVQEEASTLAQYHKASGVAASQFHRASSALVQALRDVIGSQITDAELNA